MRKAKPVARHPWTSVELEFLRRNYADARTEDLAKVLNREIANVYRKANVLGLKKSAEFLASGHAGRLDGIRGGKTRFQVGLTPWNKGKQFEPGGRSVETRFKPGTKPHNTMPIGSLRFAPDGSLQRKISEDKGSNSKRWRGVHELVWVEANGPVPPGHIVVFKSGMRTTELNEITIDKVECISLAENMKRNTRHNLPKEINEVIQLRAVLTRHINKRSKAHEQENH